MSQMSLGDFAPPLDSALSQYHTPVKLARRIVEWAKIKPGMRVLEPSAGGGNIVRELLKIKTDVTAVEIDQRWVDVLWSGFPWFQGNPLNPKLLTANFLEIDDQHFCPFDIAVMNPPLDDGVGAHHVKHALRFAPRVISILRGQDLHCKERYRELWSNCDFAGLALLVKRPVYAGKGGQIETIAVDIWRKGMFTGQQKIEHWSGSWI